MKIKKQVYTISNENDINYFLTLFFVMSSTRYDQCFCFKYDEIYFSLFKMCLNIQTSILYGAQDRI